MASELPTSKENSWVTSITPPLLEVNDLSISFSQYEAGLRQKKQQVISNLSIAIHPGEFLAVVGASGSGKSLFAHAILGILPSNAEVAGSIRYDGEELTPERQADLRGQQISLVPQSVNFLDPLMRVGTQVGYAVSKEKKREKAAIQRTVFARYGLTKREERRFPFQLSGGMARRVLVASAVISDARLIIADEPTPGLHLEVVNETLNHLRELADEGRAVMLITHDIATAITVADRIAVFYAGTTMEVAQVEDFYGDGAALRHPYSKSLWSALPQNDFLPTPGTQPDPDHLPDGCLFAPRCQFASTECESVRPELRELRSGMVRCFHAT